MKSKKVVSIICTLVIVIAMLAACSSGNNSPSNQGSSNQGSSSSTPATSTDQGSTLPDPFPISIGLQQVGDIPTKGNEVEQLIEAHTNTKLDFQWIPNSAYDDKVNVMIASNELPTMLYAKYNPAIVSSIQDGLFWEIGPYIDQLPNVSQLNDQYFDNISVDGKRYAMPTLRPVGRSGLIFRQDWMDKLGLQQPESIEDYYNVIKAMVENDPDGNGEDDTYGIMLNKDHFGSSSSVMTRWAVSLGAPNNWAVEDGKVYPDFVTDEYFDLLTLLRRLYAENLINQDFAVFDGADVDKMYDAGRVGMKIAVASNNKSTQDRLDLGGIDAVVEVEPLKGPYGRRNAGDTGSNGFYLFPKSTIKTEEELLRVLQFVDQMLDKEMIELQQRGILGKHYEVVDGLAEVLDFDLFQREVKPYRDRLFHVNDFNGAIALNDTPQGIKGHQIEAENLEYAIPNPVRTVASKTYSERGGDLETIMHDAGIKYIMGQIDEAGYQAEIERWRAAGGDQMIAEYEEELAKR